MSEFQTRHYNELADAVFTVLASSKPECVETLRSGFLRLFYQLALKNSNCQIGRLCDKAGIPSSTSPKDTRRT